MAGRVVSRTLKPFTVEHWRAYSERVILDTDDYWELEPFHIEVIRPILAGVTEVWAVLPEGNTKTTLMAGFALYHCDYTQAPWVPIAASSRDQAEIMATQAYDMIRRTPGMLERFKIQEGYRRILSLRNGGRGIKVYAADAGTGDGVIPTLCLCDEGHRWPDLSLYRLWKGKLRKRHGQIVMISTAGAPGEEFEETRDRIRNKATRRKQKGAHLHAEGTGIVLNEWAVTKPSEIANMKAVKAANPFSGITIEDLEAEFNSPTTDLGDWRRLKPLAVDTPIPTPAGWTTMLELEVGDEVLNGEGLPTVVRAATPIKLEQAYEIEFSDGAKIVATGDHLWAVDDARNHHRPTVRSTSQIAQWLYMKDGRGRSYARWRVRTAGRQVAPDADLPIDPYVLGVWLGDGSNNTGHIRNGDPEVWAELERRDCELGSLAPSLQGVTAKRMQTVLRLRPMLRAIGLLNNKHIPSQYLVAPEQARWELLQGLMDADGTVLEDGRAIFWNTNARLAGDVRRLAWSLGRPCIQREDRALLGGVDHGPRFALEISCDARHPVVRLPRKAQRLRFDAKTADHRRIRSVVPIGNQLVRCIAVDSEDSIFLAGEAYIPTHNCNIPSRSNNSAITEQEWDRALSKIGIPEDERIDVGVDVAWKHDTFAIATLWSTTEPRPLRLLGTPAILTPPRDGSSMHPDEPKMAFEAIHNRNPIDVAVMDLERAEDIAAWLEDELGITVVDRPQGNANAVEDYDAFMRDLRNGTLRHTGDPGLRQHVMNAIARHMPGDKKRFDRPSQSRARRRQVVRVIDALTAAAMVNQYASDYEAEGEPLLAWR